MPLVAKNTAVTDLLQSKLGIKRQSARSYASQLRKLFNLMQLKGEMKSLAFLEHPDAVDTVKKLQPVNVRKNMSVAALAGARATGMKTRTDDFRRIMVQSDAEYQRYAQSGARRKGFSGDAAGHWKTIQNLHKVIARIVSSRQLYKRQDLTHDEVTILQQLVYTRLLAHYDPRRLEYVLLRFISPTQLKNIPSEHEKKLNYFLTTPKKWTIHYNNFKTKRTYGSQVYAVPPGFRTVLQKVQKSLALVNTDGLIFFNRSGNQMGYSAFSQFIKKTFKTYLNRSWTQNVVRSIKISSMFRHAPSTREMLDLQNNMGSAISTQLTHYRVPQTQ